MEFEVQEVLGVSGPAAWGLRFACLFTARSALVVPSQLQPGN